MTWLYGLISDLLIKLGSMLVSFIALWWKHKDEVAADKAKADAEVKKLQDDIAAGASKEQLAKDASDLLNP